MTATINSSKMIIIDCSIEFSKSTQPISINRPAQLSISHSSFIRYLLSVIAPRSNYQCSEWEEKQTKEQKKNFKNLNLVRTCKIRTHK